jgi:hypothetical protein
MQHNLDIQTYSLDELFHLLDLPTTSPTAEQMLQAKRKVLKFHPDKSRLPTQYFIFYKNAYETVERYYREQNKVNRAWTESDLQYRPIQAVNERAVKKTLQQQEQQQNQPQQQKQPQQKAESKQNNNFNLAFESIVKKPSAEPKNKWFYEEKPIFEPPQEKVQVKNMAQAMDKFKEKAAAQQALIAHQEVQTLASGSAGTQYFDEEEEDDDDAATSAASSRSRQYISTDPFSKLKYDDLRKVHKDQTVLAVSEKDFGKVKKYSSVEHYVKERSADPITPISKKESEDRLQREQELAQRRHMERLHRSNLQVLENEKKSQQFSAYLMQLENGNR